MTANASITRRLILSVLLLECLAAIALIITVANHERRVQFQALDANLRASANALLGAVQEASSKDGRVVLDRQGMSLPCRAIYSVKESTGIMLGAQGDPPVLTNTPGSIAKAQVGGRPYRFFVLTGERVIDPGTPTAVYHHIRVVYGLPEGRVWHAIMEAVRFFAIATLVLLGITGLLLTWLIERSLQPIRELAHEAEKISPENWTFDAPPSSKRFVELRVLASSIEKTVLRLQRSFEQQRRFTSDAAHELKTDLAIIKSSAQLLMMRRRTVEEYEHGIALAREDIARLEATVQKMLALARLEQGSRDCGASCDLRDAALEAITQIQPIATLKQVTLHHHGLEQAIHIPMSREDAVLLCSNVLMNAIQHSPSPAEVEVLATKNDHATIIQVRDHGPGASEQDLPFLFDAFYRGDPSRSRQHGGTGLGLSICKAICERAGGTISIANHPEGGVIVEITLPLAPSPQADT